MPRVKATPRRVIIQHSLEKNSSFEDEWTDGLREGVHEQNEVSHQETVQGSGSQQGFQPGKTGDEKNPIPGPCSSEGNNDRAKKETRGAKPKKISTLTDTDSKKIRKQDRSGKCGECHRVYADISGHSKNKHNKELKSCTTTGCKIYFASAQKRSEHDQRFHRVYKKFRCQHCNYSTDAAKVLRKHVQRKHLEKKIKCGEPSCGKMFASEADLRDHIKKCHQMEKCLKCGRELSRGAMHKHNRNGKCPGK